MPADTLAAYLGAAIAVTVVLTVTIGLFTEDLRLLIPGLGLAITLSIIMGLGYTNLIPGVTNPPPLKVSRAEAQRLHLQQACGLAGNKALLACRRLAGSNALAVMEEAFPTNRE